MSSLETKLYSSFIYSHLNSSNVYKHDLPWRSLLLVAFGVHHCCFCAPIQLKTFHRTVIASSILKDIWKVLIPVHLFPGVWVSVYSIWTLLAALSIGQHNLQLFLSFIPSASSALIFHHPMGSSTLPPDNPVVLCQVRGEETTSNVTVNKGSGEASSNLPQIHQHLCFLLWV